MSNTKQATFLFIVLILAVSHQRAESDDLWTGWLGPDRNGWVSEFQPPTEWPESLTKAWTVEVGTGYGSPLVVKGCVYQHTRQADDEVVWCIDRLKGSKKATTRCRITAKTQRS